MNLSSFSSFFEIFCGINLAYAGSDTFVFSVKKIISNSDHLINGIKSQIEITEAQMTVSGITSENYKARLRNLSAEFDQLSDVLIARKEHNSFFVLSHKSLFLLSGLYCLFLLVLMGYEQFHQTQYNPVPRCMLWISFIGIVNIFLFLRSYFKYWVHRPSHFGFIFLVFSIWASLSMYFCYEDTFRMSSLCNKYQEYLAGLSILMACSGFLLFFFRSLHHELVYRFRFYILTKYFNFEVKEIQYLEQFNKSAIGKLEKKPFISSAICEAILRFHKLYVYTPLNLKVQIQEQEKII